MKASELRKIPAVEKILQAIGPTDLPRAMIVSLVRREVAAIRAGKSVPEADLIIAQIHESVRTLARSRIQPVINGTGIMIHTNLGRAPLAPEVIQSLAEIGSNFNNLEYDLDSGERGSRSAYLEAALAELCGAQASTVVNNCAAALVLILRHFTASKPEVIISRGELVQIGGGFRIPEILESSGARLREIGTTNKTSLSDYAKAINANTGLILRVHRSNFFMGGFVESVGTEELSLLARKKRIPFVEDLGSGAVIATERLANIEHEPTPNELLRQGVDLVCFSGDKLLGGPQAGIICGRAKMIAALKKEPFYRALRCDKLILSAMQTLVELYLSGDGRGAQSIPLVKMLSISSEELEQRVSKILDEIRGLSLKVRIGSGKSQLGGGTLPQSVLPSVTLDVQGDLPPQELAARMRMNKPPVIGYVHAGWFKLDLRTIFPNQDPLVTKAFGLLFR